MNSSPEIQQGGSWLWLQSWEEPAIFTRAVSLKFRTDACCVFSTLPNLNSNGSLHVCVLGVVQRAQSHASILYIFRVGRNELPSVWRKKKFQSTLIRKCVAETYKDLYSNAHIQLSKSAQSIIVPILRRNVRLSKVRAKASAQHSVILHVYERLGEHSESESEWLVFRRAAEKFLC